MSHRFRIASAAGIEVLDLEQAYLRVAHGLECAIRIQAEDPPGVLAAARILQGGGSCERVAEPPTGEALFQPGDACFAQGRSRMWAFVDPVPRPRLFPSTAPSAVGWQPRASPPSDDDLIAESDDLRRVETMRRRCIAARRESGNALDFLDRGGPSESQAAEAMEASEQASRRAEELGRVLDVEVARLRRGAPQVVQRWAQAHLAACAALGAQLPADARTERYVLDEAVAGWHAVLAGERAWVEENGPLLPGYARELSGILGF